MGDRTCGRFHAKQTLSIELPRPKIEKKNCKNYNKNYHVIMGVFKGYYLLELLTFEGVYLIAMFRETCKVDHLWIKTIW